jgi:type I restriction enzyme R subunit
VTTSRLLSTGVDVQTCKLIVLDQTIQSMTLFKQIIGRGTRIREDYDKFFFTIMDFKRATELFADPAFDGDPVQIYEPRPDASPVPPDEPDGPSPAPVPELQPDDVPPPVVSDAPRKYYVDDVPVAVVAERVQYFGPDGKLITESLRDYTRKSVLRQYRSLDEFLQAWTNAAQKSAIIAELEEHGVLFDALAQEVGRELDPFDLVCHLAWGRQPKTRMERADGVRRRNYFSKYGDTARAVMEALLDKYADIGVAPIEDFTILNVHPISELGTPLELVAAFGGRDGYLQALSDLEAQLYAA